MQITKIIPKHIVEKEVVDKEICDICNEEIEKERGCVEQAVNINAYSGEAYPESDCRNGYIIDVCYRCFDQKVKPLLENSLNLCFRKVKMDDKGFEEFYK